MKRFEDRMDTTAGLDGVTPPLPTGGWPRRVCPGLTLLALQGLLLLFPADAQAQALDLGLQTGVSDAHSAELYTQYSKANVNLTPLAQIDAWLGFLKLHPETPYRDQIRWRLRYLAASLSSRDEAQLLAILAYQQLPDRLAALEDPTLRLQACAEFIQAFPALFDNYAYHSSFLTLLERLGNREPEAFVVRFLNPSQKPESLVATQAPAAGAGAAAVKTPAVETPGAGPEAMGGSAVVLSRPTEGREGERSGGSLEPAASPASSGTGSSTVASTGAGTGADTQGRSSAESASSPATAGAIEAGKASNGAQKDPNATQSVASIPPTGASDGSAGVALAQSPLSGAAREAERFTKWTVATQNLTPEARLQLWTTYLLLYPETPHLDEIQARIAKASAETQAVKQNQEAVQARLLALEAEVAVQRDNQQAEQERQGSRRAFRRALLGLGGLLLLTFLIGAL